MAMWKWLRSLLLRALVPNRSSPAAFLKPRLTPYSVHFYLHKLRILNSVSRASPVLSGRLLDVGCGIKPYASLLPCQNHIGIDVSSCLHQRDNIDCVYDGHRIPFRSEAFDSVLCTDVIEHCERPGDMLVEIARVLKPGGHALVTAPFVIGEHEEPFDFCRFTSFGMRYLAEAAELQVSWIEPRGGSMLVAVDCAYATARAIVGPWANHGFLWGAFPFTALAIHLDRYTLGQQGTLTLGWQMLLQKPRVVRDPE